MQEECQTKDVKEETTKKDKLRKALVVSAVAISLVAAGIPIGVYAYNDTKQKESIQQVDSKQEEYKQTIEWFEYGIDELDNAGCIDRINSLKEAYDSLSKDDWKLYNGEDSGYYSKNRSYLDNAIEHVRSHAYDLYNSRIDENTVDTTGLSENDCNSYKDSLDSIRTEIDEARDIVFPEEDDSSSYDELVTKIDNQKAIYDSTIEDIKAKEEEERKAAEEAASRNPHYNGQQVKYNKSEGSYGYYNDSGVWTPAYTDDYYSDSASSDGSLTQWADGYYIAHRWSSNGRAIASRPEEVYINGRYYRYVSSRVVSTDQEYDDEFESYTHQNDGIAFQTCTDGGYLVNHYEPVD